VSLRPPTTTFRQIREYEGAGAFFVVPGRCSRAPRCKINDHLPNEQQQGHGSLHPSHASSDKQSPRASAVSMLEPSGALVIFSCGAKRVSTRIIIIAGARA